MKTTFKQLNPFSIYYVGKNFIPVGIPIANHKTLGSHQLVSGTFISAWAMANDRSASTPIKIASGGMLSIWPTAWQPYKLRHNLLL